MQDPNDPNNQNQTASNSPTPDVRPDFQNVSVEEVPPADAPIAEVSSADSQEPVTPPAQVIFTPSDDRSKLKAATAVAVVFALLSATGIGVFLAGRQQLQPASAWDCSKYNFAVSQQGVVTVLNGSTRNEPPQKANVKINGTQVASYDVPALSQGQSATLGNVTVPTSGTWSWEVKGTLDCEDGGSYQNNLEAKCSEVKAYNVNWSQIANADLPKLKAGDVVRFTVSGTASTGNFDKAKFTINGAARAEVTAKRPGSDEFYDEYIIPTGTTTFTVTAQVHHQQNNQWY